MNLKRKSYTREFKLEAVHLVTTGESRVYEVARDLGVHPNTIYKWIQQHGENPERAFPGSGNQTEEDGELTHLKSEVRRLRMERDILKKAMAIFSADPR